MPELSQAAQNATSHQIDEIATEVWKCFWETWSVVWDPTAAGDNKTIALSSVLRVNFKIGNESVSSLLAGALRSGDMNAASTALWLLTTAGILPVGVEFSELLASHLVARNSTVRWVAAAVVRRLGSVANEQVRAALLEASFWAESQTVKPKVTRLPNGGVALNLESAENRDKQRDWNLASKARREAIEALRCVAGDEGVPEELKHLMSRPGDVSANETLQGHLVSSRARVGVFMAGLTAGSAYLISQAETEVEGLQPADATEELINLLETRLHDPEFAVRLLAVRAVGRLGPGAETQQIIEGLEQILLNDDSAVAHRAEDAVLGFRPVAVTAGIIRALLFRAGKGSERDSHLEPGMDRLLRHRYWSSCSTLRTMYDGGIRILRCKHPAPQLLHEIPTPFFTKRVTANLTSAFRLSQTGPGQINYTRRPIP